MLFLMLYSILLRNVKNCMYKQVLGEIEKKAAMGYYGTRDKKTYVFEYPEDYEKRLFASIRGKLKEFPMEWEKRAPMGFQGMRGKKSLLDEIEELEKRTIMGFQVICSIVKLYVIYSKKK